MGHKQHHTACVPTLSEGIVDSNMNAGVQDSFDGIFIAEVNKLVAEAETIIVDANPHQDFPYGHDYKTREKYHEWLRKVRTQFNTDDLQQYLPADFFFAQHLELPSLLNRGYGTDLTRDQEYRNECIEYRTKLHKALTTQIASLKQVKVEFEAHTVIMTIYIEKNREIWREPRNKYSYHSPNSKRFKMFKMVAENEDHVKTKTLVDKLKYDSRATLAGEKREFNETLCKHLGITQDVILGGEQTPKQGYSINPVFDVKIVKTRS